MAIGYNHVRVRIRVDDLAHNFKVMNAHGSNACAVVKSDAYGHGLAVAAEAFAGAGATSLAVGTVEEAARLSATTFTGRVIALLGPQLPEDYAEAVRLDVVSFCARRGQLRRLDEAAAKAGRRARVALKFDTGMNRLGFGVDEAADILDTVRGLEHVDVEIVASHLACADEPDRSESVHEQAGRFQGVVDTLRAGGLSFEASLANSAAMLAFPELGHDLQRPGISLYGADPLRCLGADSPGLALRPAMDVSARVYQVHDLGKGQGVSYGLTYTAERDMRVAVVGVGYADNYSRSLSGTGQVVLHGRRAPILGRVCMQMAVIDVSDIPAARAGDTVWLMGGPDEAAVHPCELAGWWGTIGYEVYCALGMNRREYVLDSRG